MLKIWNLFWRLLLSTLCRLTSGSTFCEFDGKVKGPVSTVFRASVSKARFLLRGRGNWQWCRVSVALHPSIQETHSYVFWLLQLFFSFNESLGGLFFFSKFSSRLMFFSTYLNWMFFPAIFAMNPAEVWLLSLYPRNAGEYLFQCQALFNMTRSKRDFPWHFASTCSLAFRKKIL